MISIQSRQPVQGSAIGAMAALGGLLRQIGRGATRTVFLSADGRTVYKVASYRLGIGGFFGADQQERCQMDEYRIANVLRMMGVDGIPPTTIWYVPDPIGRSAGLVPVVAMPVYPGDAHGDPDAYDAMRAICANVTRVTDGRYRMGDMHDANYRKDANGKVWIIDLGFCERDDWACRQARRRRRRR